MHHVYTLENLEEATSCGKPARLAVIGNPISHSSSPQLHQPALDAFGKEARYIRLLVEPGMVAEAFAKMTQLGFIGCNVTVPHKIEAMEACGEVSEQARQIGAVNTVVFSENEIHGYNTDGPGFMQAVSDDFGIALGENHTLILGAGGGAGQAIATQCALLKPVQLTLINRSLDKITDLAERLRDISPETEITTLAFGDPGLIAACHSADLLVQTTSLGLKQDDPEVIPSECFQSHHCVYDTIYQPPETHFLKAARNYGCKTGNGLSMLIHQGAIAFQHWFPETDPLSLMKAAMKG
ncbi:MAG: shikimate dehydrogenase [Akkermansiaceae bacterium]|jgi:shikimate dehydrogenase|nr:shikimate dehydrogenase [Akkermansiaceae bacterium]MDP4646674.1 shikimate dehydrogenase [Akkermansiaceae bacterium]MDP4721116.1 shikimate dehydrogenase [Akkermansiaceae bacterium]MDP4779590.1 shikimate dehydrogenase [Akkermansiaceae bacterium]MDP4846330.1 shikimate dehydrogenase [Akkermansiaceae bacterium]